MFDFEDHQFTFGAFNIDFQDFVDPVTNRTYKSDDISSLVSFKFESKGGERTKGDDRERYGAGVNVHVCDSSDTEFLKQMTLANEAIKFYRTQRKARGPFFCVDKPELLSFKGAAKHFLIGTPCEGAGCAPGSAIEQFTKLPFKFRWYVPMKHYYPHEYG